MTPSLRVPLKYDHMDNTFTPFTFQLTFHRRIPSCFSFSSPSLVLSNWRNWSKLENLRIPSLPLFTLLVITSALSLSFRENFIAEYGIEITFFRYIERRRIENYKSKVYVHDCCMSFWAFSTMVFTHMPSMFSFRHLFINIITF